jgi:hypothetical protein
MLLAHTSLIAAPPSRHERRFDANKMEDDEVTRFLLCSYILGVIDVKPLFLINGFTSITLCLVWSNIPHAAQKSWFGCRKLSCSHSGFTMMNVSKSLLTGV